MGLLELVEDSMKMKKLEQYTVNILFGQEHFSIDPKYKAFSFYEYGDYKHVINQQTKLLKHGYPKDQIYIIGDYYKKELAAVWVDTSEM